MSESAEPDCDGGTADVDDDGCGIESSVSEGVSARASG